jgi:hypothetical protein
VRLDTLRPGARIAITLDPSNTAVQEIRALEDVQRALIVASAEQVAGQAAPSPDEVLRALPPQKGGIPYVIDLSKRDVKVTVERLADVVDPPRFFPLIGPARLHRCHWKCTVSYTEEVQSDFAFPVISRRPRVEVIYIDRDFLVLAK